jgi:VanZ family protein
MTLLRRHKTILITLGIYWPVIFLLTHIPVPAIARQSGMSDKTMHVVAYFLLTVLAWYAISPYEKVNWGRLKVWGLIGVLLAYGAIDEFLQGLSFIGRSPDVIDFLANVLGIFMALGILSMLRFWASLMAVSGVCIFVICNMSRLLLLYPEWHLNSLFQFGAYAGFTLVWIHWLEERKNITVKNPLWAVYALSGPVLLLMCIKVLGAMMHRDIGLIDLATSFSGIFLAVLLSLLLFKFTRRSTY